MTASFSSPTPSLKPSLRRPPITLPQTLPLSSSHTPISSETLQRRLQKLLFQSVAAALSFSVLSLPPAFIASELPGGSSPPAATADIRREEEEAVEAPHQSVTTRGSSMRPGRLWIRDSSLALRVAPSRLWSPEIWQVKDAPESCPRAVSSSSSRGSRTDVDRRGRTSSTQYSSYDYGISRGKPAFKKENETYGFPISSILGPNMAGNNLTRKSTGSSESAFMENKTHPTGLDDGMPSSSQPSSGYQNNWAAKPGHVSMAYIVKMGKPQGKTSNMSLYLVTRPTHRIMESY